MMVKLVVLTFNGDLGTQKGLNGPKFIYRGFSAYTDSGFVSQNLYLRGFFSASNWTTGVVGFYVLDRIDMKRWTSSPRVGTVAGVYTRAPILTLLQSLGGNISVNSTMQIFPVMGYNHSEVNNNEGSASIIGGYFYRSMTNPCMYGRYLYGDLYAGARWAGTENLENSGNFTTSKISFGCAHDSPIPCSFMPGSSLHSFGCAHDSPIPCKWSSTEAAKWISYFSQPNRFLILHKQMDFLFL